MSPIDTISVAVVDSMLLGYNTNGFAHHDLIDAIGVLAEVGYQGVAISLDHHALNPYEERINAHCDRVAELLSSRSLCSVIETGARFLLNPHIKHEPTLVTADPAGRARRVDFLCRGIDMAVRLKAACVSIWSGVVHDGAGEREAMARLVGGLAQVVDYAQKREVVLAFEPEPGMLIDTLARYADLLDELAGQRIDISSLRLTIDVGHLHCLGEVPLAGHIRRWADRLVNIHIEDMRSGIHEHLMFGEGEIEFQPVFAALAEIGYSGLVNVELSRHSHEAPTAARRAYNYLRPLVDAAAHGRRGC
jgi:sugar phosphate isomerase/epimerase